MNLPDKDSISDLFSFLIIFFFAGGGSGGWGGK